MDSSIIFDIKYDEILFDTKSSHKIKNGFNSLLCQMVNGTLVFNRDGKYAPRYATQLHDSVDIDFRHLYVTNEIVEKDDEELANQKYEEPDKFTITI